MQTLFDLRMESGNPTVPTTVSTGERESTLASPNRGNEAAPASCCFDSVSSAVPGCSGSGPGADPVPDAPVLVRSGSEAVLSVRAGPAVFSMSWDSPSKEVLGQVSELGSVVRPVAQYAGRISITFTELRISASQLRDAGNYTVTVVPGAATGLSSSSASVELRVFDAVVGVSLFVPSVAVERGNVSLRCTWDGGTETGVIWGKAGVAIVPDSRVTILAGSLVINPARRGDAGEYTCTVRNLVSAQAATASLTVFYGPDTPVLDQGLQADCVGGGQAVVGQTVRLTCQSDSLPPALFSWQHNGVPVASGQPDSGVLSIQTFSTNQSGRYVCTARNAVTGRTSEQGTDVAIVRTCLSGGAVAGIVIGCVLALILIIIAIFLLLRWKKVDLRLRQAEGNPKPDENPQRRSPPLQSTLPQPRNHHQLHDLNTLHNADQHNGYVPPPNELHQINTLQQHPITLQHNGQLNTNTLPHNGQLNTNTFPHNGQLNTNTLPHNGQLNTNTFPQNGQLNTNTLPHNGQLNTNTLPHNGQLNTNTFPQNGQLNTNTLQQNGRQNPNILIQTGQAHPNSLAPMVHVNLNTLPHTNQQGNDAQPHTVHVNLNTYPHANQQDPRMLQNPTQHSNHVLQHTSHQNLDNSGQIGNSDRAPLIQTGESYPTNTPRSDPRAPRNRAGHRTLHPGDLVQTGFSHLVGPAPAARQNADTQTYQRDQEPESRGARRDPRDRPSGGQNRGTQMPWDRVRATPAYPNHGFEGDLESSTSGAYDSNPGPPPRNNDARTGRGQHAAETQSPRARSQTVPQNAVNAHAHSAARDPNTAAQPPPQNPRNSRPATGPQNPGTRGQSAGPTHLAPQSQPVQSQPTRQLYPAQAQAATHNAPQQTLNPLVHTGMQNRDPQMHHVAQDGQNQRQTAPPNPDAQAPLGTRATLVPGQNAPNGLTQAALQTHTARTHNPFQSRAHQTWLALQNPGLKLRPAPRTPGLPSLLPFQRLTPPPAAPTLPPILPLTQFQTLPQQPLQHHPPQQIPAPHRHPTQPARHPQHTQRHLIHAHGFHGNPHAHPNAHGHPNAHRHPTNHRQAAWGRARR
ncbi:hypothetical protein AAFF_G00329210 [Aldrovandia affinis]|uniref:Ig-like domain-containing protein n=1 Tax=Aldrovandia affinis TaxID=143900 RepID=A0AAD7WQ84_9TELE|nr:hypothetical protein AAFF_G00329210 [Aldrovandia affinis]